MSIVVDALRRPAFIAALITVAAAVAIWFWRRQRLLGGGRMMFSWILSSLGCWLSLADVILATLGVAWLKGRAAGQTAWEERRSAREKAMQQSTEVRHDKQIESDAALECRLDRWMRD